LEKGGGGGGGFWFLGGKERGGTHPKPTIHVEVAEKTVGNKPKNLKDPCEGLGVRHLKKQRPGLLRKDSTEFELCNEGGQLRKNAGGGGMGNHICL